ncbi:HIT-like superfamily protein [Babesia gibsoni]|uniref:HIT-like superfamily protein n=1 Tax=Babesia gibsoni TaxID=33632 RepID=A0AAD8PEX3_BABGI|nr:HIT-like superfamily protein [Babesia gibsoni]
MGAAPDDFLPAEVEPSVFGMLLFRKTNHTSDAIVAGKLPCKKVYEDDLVLAFHDINPVAPVHILLIPKQRDGLSRLSRADEHNEKVLGHMMVKVAQIVRENDIKDFRLVVNNGPTAGQEVYHLHLHIIAGRKMSWPPG